MFGFLDEFAEVVKSIRVQQTQTRKVTGNTQLLRSRCQKEKTRCVAAKRVDQFVFRADGLRRPAQMMGFVDDEDVPTGSQCLFEPLLAPHEQFDARENELIIEEWIRSGVDGFD